MMKGLKGAVAAAALAVGLAATPASAAWVYVGSWEVDDGPLWPDVPPAYSGQGAAALLFGGSAGDYAISTVGSDVSLIDNLAWVSTWGGACGGAFPCGTKVAEDFVDSTGGLYQTTGDTSAYVRDWAVGPEFTNYAFRWDGTGGIPEPATWAMMIMGFGLVGFAARRRETSTVSA